MATRFHEADLRNAALRELVESETGWLSTTDLIRVLERRLAPAGRDNDISDARSDTLFSQKVRNLVSHRTRKNGLEALGLARYDPARRGWAITPEGRSHIRKQP